jgi:hypothetical protein
MASKSTGAGESGGLWGSLRQRFGAVAKRLGFVGENDVEGALDHQKERKATRQPHKKIGQILVDQGKIGRGHVSKVLKEQKKAPPKAAKKAAKKSAAKKPAKPAKKQSKKQSKKKAKKKAKK